MKKRLAIAAAIVLALGAAIVLAMDAAGWTMFPSSQAAGPVVSRAKSSDSNVLLACEGRVEGRTPTVEIGAGADGVIQRVYASEGQQVKQGDVLAEIDCGDRKAELQVALADVQTAREARVRLAHGSRDEERQIAEQKTAAAKSERARAEANLERMKLLFQKSDVSRSTLDNAARDYEVADASVNEALRFEQLTNAGPLPEEMAKADAEVAVAENKARVMRERVRKCAITAPMDGTILQSVARSGESFSTVTPRPLFTMADLSARRVRAEVDERDATKAHIGQKVVAFLESRPEAKYSGVVARVSSVMGVKKVLSADPADKKDRDVLEALIDLDPGARSLPVGIRVIVQFLH